MVQVLSQNRWPATSTTEKLTRFTAAGFSFWAANADVGIVFAELISRFNSDVEPIAGPVPDDWSWADRLVRGSSTEVSNHGSATAIDLNAIHHPRGVHDTFTPAQVTAIRAILGSITDDWGRPVLRWGHDYRKALVDDMHFEINTDPMHVRQAAMKLRTVTKEKDMQLDDTIVLSEAAARAMSAPPGATPRKAGDRISVSYFLQWGGGGVANTRTEIAALAARVAALETKVTALGAGAGAGTVHQVAGSVSTGSGTAG